MVLCPRAVETAVSRIADDFHAQGGARVQFVLGTAGDLSKRAAAGERADVVIGTTQGLEDIDQRGGVLVKATRVELGRVGVGVAVKADAPRPDISTPEALRQTLLKAASLGYADPAHGGTGGTHFAGVLERLGIAEAVSPKTRLYPQGVQALEAVARGEIELAVTPTSEIVVRDGLLLVGPLPGDLQCRLSYSAAVLAVSPSSDAAKAFVARLVDAEGRRRFIAAGFEQPESPTKSLSPR
jgi:molybdate transport system substrate-binding protein